MGEDGCFRQGREHLVDHTFGPVQAGFGARLSRTFPEVPARYKLMNQNFDLRIGLTLESPHLRYIHKKMPAGDRRLVGGKRRREEAISC
jgi:hypothetical protein